MKARVSIVMGDREVNWETNVVVIEKKKVERK